MSTVFVSDLEVAKLSWCRFKVCDGGRVALIIGVWLVVAVIIVFQEFFR